MTDTTIQQNTKAATCGYQVLSPRSYRLIVTITLQGHPGSRGHSEITLGVDPRECGYACTPPRFVSTPPT